MSVQLNHHIVWSRDQKREAAFLTDILGLPPATQFSHFDVVELGNGVSLDFHTDPDNVKRQHYAFLVSEAEFDGVFQRIKDRSLTYWADPARRKEGEINRHDSGRGMYFESPDGHLLEVLTRPYGSGGA
ncbi:MAG: VOC family protein [Reyranellaceae bacterium]